MRTVSNSDGERSSDIVSNSDGDRSSDKEMLITTNEDCQ